MTIGTANWLFHLPWARKFNPSRARLGLYTNPEIALRTAAQRWSELSCHELPSLFF